MKTFWKILIGVAIVAGVVLIMRSTAKVPEKVADIKPEERTPLSPQAGLPEVVEAKRQAIAAAKSYEELAALAGENFSYSFGGPYEGGVAAYLKMEEENTGIRLLERVDAILTLPYYKRFDTYVWPGIFEKEAKDWTEEDLRMMKTIATDKEIEQYRQFGSYIGWRLGIREDGEWIYFIAGD